MSSNYVENFLPEEQDPDVKDKNVVILDFSFDNKTTKNLIKEAKSLIVIDHHKSAVV